MQQREYYRVDLSAFCSLRLRQLGTRMLPIGETFEAEVQNISGGGLCFLADRDLPVNDLLAWQFQIDLPDETIEVFGHVVWKTVQENMYLYGVKFIFFEEHAQRDLISKINVIQIQRKQREKYLWS